MAKQSGLGSRFLVGGFDLSGDINALSSIAGTMAPIDATDITQSAHSRIPGLRDGNMAFTSFFDAANAHPVLSALPTADVLMSYLVPPLVVGSPVACVNAKQVSYNGTRGNAGDLMFTVEGQANGFAEEWCLSLTPGIRADTAATNGADLDGGAATTFGAQAYLQVTQFTGSSATITVQHSPDNATWSTLAAFAAVDAAPDTQRIAVAGSVDRFTRVISAGTFTSLQFAAFLDRNPVATAF